MEKTKLGISVGMLAALCYFAGMMGLLTLVIIAGYVMIFETNEWLKKSAVKAVAIVVGFAILGTIISTGSDIFIALNEIFSWLDMETRLSYPQGSEPFVRNVLSVCENVLLLILGFKAFKQASVKVSVIDSTINKHM